MSARWIPCPRDLADRRGGRGIFRGIVASGLFFFLSGLCACGAGAHAPRLSDLRCRGGERACQSLADPFLLELEVDLFDPDGDLSGGFVQRFLDRKAIGDRESLSRLLRTGGMAPGSTKGTLPLDLGLEILDLRDGMRVEVALQIEDAAGHASNRPGLELQLGLQ